MKNKVYLILIMITLMISISAVNAGIFDGFFGEETQNITLTDIKTSGGGYLDSNGEKYYNYHIEGILNDLPTNVNNEYKLKGLLFDEENNLIMEEDGSAMKYVAKDSKNLEPSKLVNFYNINKENISHIELRLYNPENELIFNQSVPFNMTNMEYHFDKIPKLSDNQLEKYAKERLGKKYMEGDI